MAQYRRATGLGIWLYPALSARVSGGSGALYRRRPRRRSRGRALAAERLSRHPGRGGCAALSGRLLRSGTGGAWAGRCGRPAPAAPAIVAGAGAGRPSDDRGPQSRQPVGPDGALALRPGPALFPGRTRCLAAGSLVRAGAMAARALRAADRQPNACPQRNRMGTVRRRGFCPAWAAFISSRPASRFMRRPRPRRLCPQQNGRVCKRG